MDPDLQSLFDPNSIAYDDPGFTSPGFQLQLPSSGLQGQQVLQSNMACGNLGLASLPGSQLQLSSSDLQGQQLLQSNLGLNNVFDPAGSAFDQAFDQMLQQVNSGKRSSPGQFPNDANLPLHKRQTLQGQQPGSMRTMLDMNVGNVPSIPSNATWSGQFPSPSASELSQASLGTGQAANQTVFNSAFLHQSNPVHVSPYGSAEYQQTPTLQRNLLVPGNSDNTLRTLQSLLQAAEQKVKFLADKCNRYQDALHQYIAPDPKTGKLPMQLLEDEVANLREMYSAQEANLERFEVEKEDWIVRYKYLLSVYERLRRDLVLARTALRAKGVPPTPQSLPEGTTVDSSAHAGSVAEYVAGSITGPGPSSVANHADAPVAALTTAPVAEPVASNKNSPIDLTIELDNGSAAATVSSNDLPTEKPGEALANFRRSFNQKELKWLQPPADFDATQDLYKQFNPRERGNYGFGGCREIIETQKGVRRALGGPFHQDPAPRREQPFSMPAPKPTTPPEAKTAATSRRHQEKTDNTPSPSKSKKPRKKEQMMTPDEIFEDDPTKYVITDEELARLLEEEMASTVKDDPPQDVTLVTDEDAPHEDDLDSLFEE